MRYMSKPTGFTSRLVLLLSTCLTICLAAHAIADTSTLRFTTQHDLVNDGTASIFTSATHTIPPAVVKTRPLIVYRPDSADSIQKARQRSMYHAQSELVNWRALDTVGPDVHDRDTILQLARMAGNAYVSPPTTTPPPNWYDIDTSWEVNFPFGWDALSAGFRGHVFLSSDNSTAVLAIKGTTLRGTTAGEDKRNDNLLFSCCCAYVDWTWALATVCGCHSRGWRCDSQCLNEALVEESGFYRIGVDLVNNLTAIYPTSNLWLVGHSLGGALASLLGTSLGLPAVAFESPGERAAAARLHLPLPPHVPVTHVYHTADPIAQGTCTGSGSPCAAAGYAIETRCHLGKSIVYDTVERLGWHADVRRHPIRTVIRDVLEVEGEWEEGREVPLAKTEEDCVDCFKWEYYDELKRHNQSVQTM